MKKFFITACLLIFLFNSAYGISLSAEVGFSGYYKPETWIPVKIYLENNDLREFHGKIEIQTEKYTFYRDVYLKPSESKTIEMEIFLLKPKNELEILLIENNGRTYRYVADIIPVKRYIVLSDLKISIKNNEVLVLNLDERKKYGSADAIVAQRLTEALKEYACMGGNLVLISENLHGRRLHENLSKVRFGKGYIFYSKTKDIPFILENFVLSKSYGKNENFIYIDYLERKMGFSYITGIFIIYILIVGPINYIILKRKKKLEYAWLTIPIIAIIFTILIYFIAYLHAEGNLAIYESGVIIPCNDIAVVEQTITIYSPKKESYFIFANVERFEKRYPERRILELHENGFKDIFYMWNYKHYRNTFILNKDFNIESKITLNGTLIKGYIKSKNELKNAKFSGFLAFKSLGNITETNFTATLVTPAPADVVKPVDGIVVQELPVISDEPVIYGDVEFNSGVSVPDKNFTKKTKYIVKHLINDISFFGRYEVGVIYRVPYADAGFIRLTGSFVEIDKGTFIAVAEPILSIYNAKINKIIIKPIYFDGVNVWIFNWKENRWEVLNLEKEVVIDNEPEKYFNGVIKLKFSYNPENNKNNKYKRFGIELPRISLEVEKL